MGRVADEAAGARVGLSLSATHEGARGGLPRAYPAEFTSWWSVWTAQHARRGKASSDVVRALEEQSSAPFPDPHRRFVIEVADGGMGPGCGMFSIEDAVADAPEWTGALSSPFCYGDEDARAAITKRLGGDKYFMLPVPGETPGGCLLLAYTGCGCFDVLVTNGEQESTVWYFDTRQLFPYHDKQGHQVRFFDWYDEWLDGWLCHLRA